MAIAVCKSAIADRAADAGHTRVVIGVALATGVVSLLRALAGGVLASWPILVLAAFVLDMAVARA